MLGFTTVGLTGSVSSARRHWLIKYVDHTKYTVTWKNGDADFATTQGEKGELVVVITEKDDPGSLIGFERIPIEIG